MKVKHFLSKIKKKIKAIKNKKLKLHVDTEAETASTNKPTLPTDCLVEILQYLVDDKATLFSAALVSRTWCRISIPFLWSSINVNRNKTSLIETFIKCMNDDECEAVSEYLKPSYPPPLFLYTSYVKELDWNKVDYLFVDNQQDPSNRKSIWKSILQMANKEEKEKIVKRMMTQICTLIFRTATSLEKFVVDIRRTRRAIPAFAMLPNCSAIFSRLKEVQLIGSAGVMYYDVASVSSREIIRLMQSVSSNIGSLKIHLSLYHGCIDDLCDLIKIQNRLEHVSFTGINDDHLPVIQVLQTQAKWLVSLEFKNTCIFDSIISLLSNLGIFTKLESLIFNDCYPKYNLPIVRKFVSQPPRCLRKLYIDYNFIQNDDEFLVMLIETSGRYLEDLIIMKDCSETMYKAIGKYCKSLLSLQINPAKLESLSLSEVIAKLQNLKHLSLVDPFGIKGTFPDELWAELSRKSSSNLCSLHFNYSQTTPRALTNFLSNRGEPIKVFEFGRHVHLTDEHLLAILNYCKERQVFVKIYSLHFRQMEKFDSSLIKQLEEWVRLVPRI
ncbi:8873_t:CDS:1 [Ambispora leptoticha]|uniref:8873_t:CDS:1 n=1 Tax=Ambispora leptoticha TaxID=144679 RepID=A0A9N9DKN1_9GLOM|nr:8873_t:CDS:1 [Ambispora leptoticha]